MNRRRLTDHSTPRDALYVARGQCPKCKAKTAIQDEKVVYAVGTKNGFAVCRVCGWARSIEELDKRIEGEVRVVKTKPGPIPTVRAMPRKKPSYWERKKKASE